MHLLWGKTVQGGDTIPIKFFTAVLLIIVVLSLLSVVLGVVGKSSKTKRLALLSVLMVDAAELICELPSINKASIILIVHFVLQTIVFLGVTLKEFSAKPASASSERDRPR